MTAPLSHQTVPVKDTATTRRRRRRAAAGGAADDCFTCSKRNVKCDRRRPYCSQCLEIGNECSGYKTQLTWNVGVASRGKLRGLSLPIAKAPPVAREPKKSPARSRANSIQQNQQARRSPVNAQQQQLPQPHMWNGQDEQRRPSTGTIDIPAGPHHASAPTTPYGMAAYDYLSMSHAESVPAMSHGSWSSVGSMPYGPSLGHSPHSPVKYSKFPLPLVTDGLSSTMDTVGNDVDFISPMSQFSREEMPFVHSPNVVYDSYGNAHHTSPGPHSPQSSIVLDPSRAPTSCPSLVYAPSPSSGLNSHIDPFETHFSHKMISEGDNISVHDVDAYGSLWTSSSQHGGDLQAPSTDSTPRRMNMTESRSVHVNPELIAKMPFFMDYYKTTICPSLVLIDGPANPFREHILHLAGTSQSLQHAICALSACNLRMKRRLSLGQGAREMSEKLMAEKQAAEAVPDTQVEDQSLSEEYQHRNLAVNLLNQQLNDNSKSSHDSVLATILLLCHYRMVESGIAKFHTQFAGIKKILGMRNQQLGHSSDTAWMEAIFTYFDAISASVNDREAQLISPFQGGPGEPPILPAGTENLVGCDRELFRTISKLGRLNLLSQHRPVQQGPVTPGADLTGRRSQSPIVSPLGHTYKEAMGSPHQQQAGDVFGMGGQRFDGNGFGTTLNDNELMASAMNSTGSFEDQRSAFWQEWKEARLALQNWHFDSAAMVASLPNVPSASQLRDIGSLSEAFRYAGLLYLERLASPNLPSNHANFQNLVSQVVYYATSLENGSPAEKYLLWPMFIAGSECVNSMQQDMLRSKAQNLMSRSGYMNNLAALDIFDRLWEDNLKESGSSSPARKVPGQKGHFNWSKYMGGPRADVEWLMF